MKQTKIIALNMIFSLIVSLCLTPDISMATTIRLDRKTVQIKEGETLTLKINNNKKKAKWKITSGKKYIRLSSKKNTSVKVKGIKKGTAKVQCKIGKKKWYCKVRVTAAGDKRDVVATPTGAPTITPSEMPTQVPTTTPSEIPTQAPTTVPTQSPTPDKNEKNSSDVMALQTLIKQQQQYGAKLTDNIDDDKLYEWNEEGRLISVRWECKRLSGDLSFAGLPALTTIKCYGNSDLNTLDISQNECLINLDCSWTGLITLDISSNTELKTVWAYNCYMMKELDAGRNESLKELFCWGNSLTSLDVRQCTSLETLGCGMNHLTTLDISQDVCLKEFYCQSNDLTTLDVSKNILLEILLCQNNQLETLDVSQNSELWGLECYQNKIKQLDLSENHKLLHLNCSDNQLSQLDVTCCPEICLLNCDRNQLTSLKIRGCKELNNFSCEDNPLTQLDVTGTKVSGTLLSLWGIEIIDDEEE